MISFNNITRFDLLLRVDQNYFCILFLGAQCALVVIMWGGPVYCIYETLFMLRLHCRHHGHADRPHVAPDLSLQQPLETGLGDRAGGARGEQEGGLLHQEQVQKHPGQEERHQDLRRPENTSGVSS